MNALALLVCSVALAAGQQPAASPQRLFETLDGVYKISANEKYRSEQGGVWLVDAWIDRAPFEQWKYAYQLRVVPVPQQPDCFLVGYVKTGVNGNEARPPIDCYFCALIDLRRGVTIPMSHPRERVESPPLGEAEIAARDQWLLRLNDRFCRYFVESPNERERVRTSTMNLQDPDATVTCIPVKEDGPNFKISYRFTIAVDKNRFEMEMTSGVSRLLMTDLATPAVDYFAAQAKDVSQTEKEVK
ncbi:hypothetical protein [Blastopirellula marina]|uniref:Uncharacterized protein n=1 Tax=Blastopirellula marina TaxID=124 RepID=A0A2S8GH27_9BACT|nr:hypothetical protein [Blastopirellula marina]PQO43743.1 hypothetical protein C5Y93_24225 [Blastopirellula marina]